MSVVLYPLSQECSTISNVVEEISGLEIFAGQGLLEFNLTYHKSGQFHLDTFSGQMSEKLLGMEAFN